MLSNSRSKPWKVSLRILAGVLLISLLLTLISPALLRYAFFRMPSPSADFDCDDSSLLMYQRLEKLGITAVPILGNLKTTGEKYWESDHIWLLVSFSGFSIALDWGSIYFDKQHYEGYSVSYDQLVSFVQQDRQQGQQGIAQPR
ncbi:MAG: hypothetical protein HY665_03390 [Chloroflexi bacterium]|nr:hypothetical protein [Chloroflexota bacterium]